MTTLKKKQFWSTSFQNSSKTWVINYLDTSPNYIQCIDTYMSYIIPKYKCINLKTAFSGLTQTCTSHEKFYRTKLCRHLKHNQALQYTSISGHKLTNMIHETNSVAVFTVALDIRRDKSSQKSNNSSKTCIMIPRK
jgi:hypothetical protein